jgi:hypothetical protein
MASNRRPVVDLTDESDPSGIVSSGGNTRFRDGESPGSAYVQSSSNPAKRSKVDTPTLNPMALLNPRAFMGQGAGAGSVEFASFPSRAQQEMDRTAVSFNKRMESLHSLKDRKVKAPSANQVKTSNGEMADRTSGHSLLSKNTVTGSSADVIDLTGLAGVFSRIK